MARKQAAKLALAVLVALQMAEQGEAGEALFVAVLRLLCVKSNVDTGLINPPPLPPPAPEGQKVQKIFNTFWIDQTPLNKDGFSMVDI